MKGATVLALCACVLLAACGRDGRDRMVQTRMPGMITAGGQSSGAVMAATSPAAPAQPGPAGTPGIPRGAEGNVGGTAMGGTAASTTPAPPASAPAGAVNAALVPASAAAAPALTDAQNGQISLNASMDAVAARWRTRAAAQGHATHAPTPVDGVAGIQASAAPPATPPPAQDIRSEKFGTAPPSPDVKQATKPATRPVVDPKAPDAAGYKP